MVSSIVGECFESVEQFIRTTCWWFHIVSVVVGELFQGIEHVIEQNYL
jgi:hypothetical protein